MPAEGPVQVPRFLQRYGEMRPLAAHGHPSGGGNTMFWTQLVHHQARLDERVLGRRIIEWALVLAAAAVLVAASLQ
jgi:hypothetical protein